MASENFYDKKHVYYLNDKFLSAKDNCYFKRNFMVNLKIKGIKQKKKLR